VIVSFLIVMALETRSQEKEFETREQAWFAYLNQTRFTNKSGLWVDLHLRMTNEFVKDVGLTIARAGYIYYLTDQTRLTAGYAYITQYGQNGTPNINEHRPWQQIQWFEKKSWYSLMQYIRLEERFREQVSNGEVLDDYLFSYRVRYNIAMTIPLKGKEVQPKIPFVFVNNELHINFGEEIVNNYFDQNRLFVGLGYQFTSQLNAHLGYLYVFQQLPEGNKYVNTNAIRLFVFHNLDFRSRDTE
jgi:hypothetical protein